MALTKKSPDAAAEAVMNGATTFEDTATDTAQVEGAVEAQEVRNTVHAVQVASKGREITTPSNLFGANLPAELRDTLANVEFGVLPRIIADQGGLSVSSEDIDLGKWADAQIVSVRPLYIVSPGGNGEEAKKLVAYSKDGEVIDDTGETCASYVAKLKLDGYTDASIKSYLEVIALLDGAENESDLVGQPVLFSLSPQSMKKFQRFIIAAQLRASQKQSLDGLDRVRFQAAKKSGNGRNWTEIDTMQRAA